MTSLWCHYNASRWISQTLSQWKSKKHLRLLTQLTFFWTTSNCAEKRSQQDTGWNRDTTESLFTEALNSQQSTKHKSPFLEIRLMALKHFKNATPSTSVVNESLPWQRRSKPSRLGFRTGFRHHPNVANHRRALKIDEARWLIQWRSFFNSSREVGCYMFFWGMSEVFCLFSKQT